MGGNVIVGKWFVSIAHLHGKFVALQCAETALELPIMVAGTMWASAVPEYHQLNELCALSDFIKAYERIGIPSRLPPSYCTSARLPLRLVIRTAWQRIANTLVRW